MNESRLLSLLESLVDAASDALPYLESHSDPRTEEIQWELEIQIAQARKAIELGSDD